jgi:hypothetical protein
MTSGSTGEKIKEKVKETIGAGEGTGQGIKEKVKETIGAGEGTGQGIKEKVKETVGMGSEGKSEELGPGAATKLEDEVAKTSSDSPTKRVEGPGKALGKEEGAE